MALLKHPDKNPGDEKAAENFHQLQKAYEVLGDPKRRERYDRFGDDEDFSGQEWLTAYEYYRAMHPEITKQDIKGFAERYRNSKEEQEDLLAYYQEKGGDLTHILEEIICSANEDVPRYVEYFELQIKQGTLKRTKKFDATKAKVKLLPDERAEAKEEKQKMKAEKAKKGTSMDELEKMILAKREAGFKGFLNYMESKYGADDDGEEEAAAKKNKRVKKQGDTKVSPQKRKKLA